MNPGPVQLSMFHMERRSRNTLIIIIIKVVAPSSFKKQDNNVFNESCIGKGMILLLGEGEGEGGGGGWGGGGNSK